MQYPAYQPSYPNPNQPNQRQRPARQRRWLPWLIIGGSFGVGLLLIAGVVAVLFVVYSTANHIPQGVTVAGVNIGGKTVEAASAALTQNLANQNVTLTDGDRQWLVSLRDLGVQFDSTKTTKAAQQAKQSSAVQPQYTVNLDQTQKELASLSDQINVAPDVGRAGRAMDVPVILDRLRVDASGELADGSLDLNMFPVDPLQPQSGANYNGPTTQYTVEAGQELGLIAKEYNVSMNDIVSMNNISNPDLLYVGEQLTIPAAGVYEPTQADAPPAPNDTGKSILVSLTNQRIYAYENGQLVRSHLVSTGLPGTPTVLGDYKIYVKYLADDMSGPGYFLPQVPYTMYFYEGYAIHGTYWHNAFGRPMSHGCVNLPTDEAEWFYNWASVGTPVRVIA